MINKKSDPFEAALVPFLKVLLYFGKDGMLHATETQGYLLLEMDDSSWWVLTENVLLQHLACIKTL